MSAEDASPAVDSGIDNLADKIGGLNTDDHPRTEEEYAQAQLTLRASLLRPPFSAKITVIESKVSFF